MSSLLNIYMRAVHGFYRESIKRSLGPNFKHAKVQTGSVIVIQRFGSALNLNVHFHVLFLDGAYFTLPCGKVDFFKLPLMHTEQVQRVIQKIQVRILCHLQKEGLVARAEADGGGEHSEDESQLISEGRDEACRDCVDVAKYWTAARNRLKINFKLSMNSIIRTLHLAPRLEICI